MMGTHGEQLSNTKLYNINIQEMQSINMYNGENMEDTDSKVLITEKMKDLYEDILYVLEDKKVYLDAHLNLAKLSHILFTNTTYLSKVINIYFKCNLKTLLNRYRINYAKELLKKDEECDIQSLPAKCGFISRSTFYNAFTKFEHITPLSFKSRIQSLRLRNKEI